MENPADPSTDDLQRRISELENSEIHLKKYFTGLPMGLALHEVECDESGKPINYKFLDVNPAFEQLLGVAAKDVIGKSVLDVFPETEEYWISTWGQVALDGKPRHLEKFFSSMGSYYDAYAFCPQHGQVVVAFADVTERREAEEARIRSESNLRTLFDTVHDFVFVIDLEGTIVEANRAVLDKLGFESDDLLGSSIASIHPIEQLDEVNGIFAEILSGKRDTCPLPIVARDGTTIPVETKIVRGLWESQDVLICLGRDTSDRLRAAEEVEKLAAAVRHCSELINIATLEGNMVFLNAAGGRMLGIEPDEVEGTHIMQVIPDHLEELVTRELLPTLLRGDTWEGDIQYKNLKTGNLTDVHAVTFAVKDTVTDTPLFLANVSVDITERIRTERQLRLSEHKYRSMFETTVDALFTLRCTSTESRFTDCNARATEMFGWPRDEMIGKSPDEVSPPNQPDGTASSIAAKNHINKALTGFPQNFDWMHCKKDGTPFHAEVTLNRVMAGEEPLLQASVRDVSERIRVEKQRRELETRLQEAQKVESLSVLAGGVAHDFNNLLTGVLGNAELALADLSPSAPGRAEVERIRTAALRAAELSRQMLAYSGKGQFVLEPVSLSDVLREIRHLMTASVSKSALLECDFAESIPAVDVDVAQIRQAVMALLTNASEALGTEGGVVKVRTGVMDSQRSGKLLEHTIGDWKEADYAYVEVEDNGSGMDDDTRERMFDPFFTTKFAGRGLGLSALLGIVRGHNGVIQVRSAINAGTAIRIHFPTTHSPTKQSRKTPPGKQQLLIGKQILLVDDEPAVLEVGKIMLEKFGARVITAEDGLEAEKTFLKNADSTDCVVLDLTMPHMTGEEVLGRLHKIRSDVPVILSSGYGKKEVETRFGDSGFAGFLQKPYKLKELIKSIGDALAQ